MSLSLRCAALFALAAGLHLLPAQAEEVRYNQISLRADVSREVAHDRMHLTLYHESQHADPARLAAQVTEVLNRAVIRARAAKAVETSLGNRHSYPVYDDKGRKAIAWRERAELRLQSTDFSALARLGSELQDELQMAGMHFSLSSDSRKRHEEQLLQEAVAAFRARAQLLAKAMGASGYQLVRLDLNASGSSPRPPLVRMAMMKSGAMAESAPEPQIEGGSSELAVNADGVIELQMP